MLRPLTTGELLDRTFSLYRRNFWLFVLIAAAPVVCAGVALTAVFIGPFLMARSSEDPAVIAIVALLMVAAAGIGGILFIFALAMARGAMVIAVASAYFDKPARAIDCFRQMKSRVWRVFGVELGTSLIIGLAMMAFLVPGIIVATIWALALPVCVLEDAGFSVALSRSSDLTGGKRWQVFLIYFLKMIMDYISFYIAYIPLIVMIVIVASGNEDPPMWIFALFLPLYGICQIVFLPFSTIAFSLVYYDARVRKEALDIELLMETQTATPQALAAGGSPA